MASEEDQFLAITFHHAGTPHSFTFAPDATLSDLSSRVRDDLKIPEQNQKFLISPKPGMLKPPFTSADKPAPLLSTLSNRKITLLGSTAAQVSSLNQAVASSKPRDRHAGPIPAAKPAPSRDRRKIEASQYTFLQIRPLAHLPNPERSTRFLERLRDDPGIRASMAKHKWTVPLLTEMDPSEHTQASHEGVGRTLGLNRNGGEVIELRLRTDAYDGYRDYKTIRKTLCHELAHNVHGPHDRNFWDLCHAVEKEVDAADWRSGGHALSSQEFYEPSAEEDVADHGGWTGGEFTLGSGSSGATSAGTNAGLSRREILAKAAEERARKARES